MLIIHIVAGLLALAAGALALAATKGSPLHRRSGLVFAAAMLVMTSSAVVVAAFLRPNPGNVVAGTLTFYLVATGVLTVWRPLPHARGWAAGLMLMGFAAGGVAFALARVAAAQPNGALDGIPAAPIYLFGIVGISAALLDARLLLGGTLRGPHRLLRHLWRMGFAMWVATASFFFGQASFLPEPVRKLPLLAIPVLLVVVVLVWSMVRVVRQGRRARAGRAVVPAFGP